MGNGTELGRVRGLGSAKQGTHHWILQRVTAVTNILLVLWLFVSLITLPNYSYEVVSNWLARPLVAVPMILLLISGFWHLRLGWQVLIEDYLHKAGGKIITIMLLNIYVFALAALGIFAVARLAFTGVPA